MHYSFFFLLCVQNTLHLSDCTSHEEFKSFLWWQKLSDNHREHIIQSFQNEITDQDKIIDSLADLMNVNKNQAEIFFKLYFPKEKLELNINVRIKGRRKK